MLINQNKYSLFLFVSFILFNLTSTSQLSQCKAVLIKDTLVLENSKIKRTFAWHNGSLQSISVYNKITNQKIEGLSPGKGDVYFPGITVDAVNGSLSVYDVPGNNANYEYKAIEVIAGFGSFELKRIFRLYADCPAIACDYYIKGTAGAWKSFVAEGENLKNIEDENAKKAAEGKFLFSDKITISGNHWHTKSVEFFDASDYTNNMVHEYPALIYWRESRLRGNLLFAQNRLKNAAFFILKEAPVSNSQLAYQGFDFTTSRGEIKVAGVGIAPQDISDSNWVKGYSVVVGINESIGETGLLSALRNYQDHQRIYKEERDGMIISNTWGDRNKDTRVNEKFILEEINAGEKLGITYLQIDDGWQLGKSSNSAFKGGTLTNIWRIPGYWNVDPVKFPGGLASLIDVAKKKGIKISVWFNPANDSSLKYWERDADVLIDQYKKYGITMWKIDGVQVTDKQGEINFRKFLDKVSSATNFEAVFNLDITAGRRFAYNHLNTYGNFYLENRYTDWVNYYPYTTLRNLWLLSKYIPPQRFQIEFLNKWRNTDKYPPGDILAPANYSFDYLFATTMVAQPLAFFEISNLPTEAFSTAKLISKYKAVSKDLHNGNVFPIGDEPSGLGWTGFQSIQNNKGYFLVFRENNTTSKKLIKTILPAGKKIKLELIAGEGKNINSITDLDGNILFELQKPNTFVLYKYIVL